MKIEQLNMSNEQLAEMITEKDDERNKKMHCVLFYDTMLAMNIEPLRDDIYVRFGKPQVFNDYMMALNVYANTPYPASQIIHADNSKELLEKIKQCDSNMANANWVRKNLMECI